MESKEVGLQVESDPQNFCRVMTILTPGIVKRLDIEAKKRTMNRSLLIRLACEEFLKQNERQEAA